MTTPENETTSIGAYRVIGFLGQGNFGLVYRAFQPFLNRQIALKVINTNVSTSENTEAQFMEEARTIAKLRHPNIVTVYEFGTADHNGKTITYMVMEYLPGQTLQNLLKTSNLSVEQVLDIVEQLASALDYAHSQHIVHRDLKPANIMFSDQNQPVIVDFGLARLLELTTDQDKQNDNALGSDSTGTPAYMSPEQALGKMPTPASDQYSLALIAYEMLAKRLPFEGKSVHDVLTAKVSKSLIPLNEIAPQYSHAVSMVLQRVFVSEPENRYPSATAFARALSETLLPDRRVSRVITVSDPIQAAQLQSARQTVLGFMYGLVLVTFVLVLFCSSLFLRGYLNGDGAFIWDGIFASTSTHDGYRDVIALWPNGPAQRAGVQAGDEITTDIFNDPDVREGDFSINGLARSRYPANWNPQAGDTIERSVIRNGQPVQVTYMLERSPYNLIILFVQIPAAVLAFISAIWLLRRWDAEPSVRIFTLVLMAASFTVVASGVSYVIENIDVLAEFILLPLLLHLILVFPEPIRYLEDHPNQIWWIYLLVPVGLFEFVTAIPNFDRFNIAAYSIYAVLLLAGIIFKWGRRDLKRYPALRILIIGSIVAIVTVLIGEGLAAFDDYGTVQTFWAGNGLLLLAVEYGFTSLGSTLAVLIGTIGLHRVQLSMGRSQPTQFSANDPSDVFRTLMMVPSALATAKNEPKDKQ